MSAPTLDASLDALVAVVVAGPDVKSVSDLAGKTIAIDDRYSEQSTRRIRTAMVAAGALEVQLTTGQTTAINRLVGKEVPAAVVGLVSVSAADSFPELAPIQDLSNPTLTSIGRGQAVTEFPMRNGGFWCARLQATTHSLRFGH